MTVPEDEITRVLQVCEHTLRTLSKQDRLADGALPAFMQLSQKVRQEMERRRTADRRETPRAGVDRRSVDALDGPGSCPVTEAYDKGLAKRLR